MYAKKQLNIKALRSGLPHSRLSLVIYPALVVCWHKVCLVVFRCQGSKSRRMANKDQGSSSGTARHEELESMMKELGLREEDLDDVIFDEQVVPPEGPRWVALARVNTSKTYSQTWFFRNMRSAWDIAQEARFKPLEENLYMVTFYCLGDWERVMNDGPWNFRGDAVILLPYDGITKPSTVKLETINIWIQIHDVPELYGHLVAPLAAKVGEVLFSEPNSHDFVGNFHRVWVRINVNSPLKNVVSRIREGKRQIYRVKYERLPD